MKDKITFEQALARLEEIADILESGDNGLEHTMQLFEEANELSKFCNEKIERAEEKLLVLTKNDGGFQLAVEK